MGPEVHALGGVLGESPLLAESGDLSGHVRQIALEPRDRPLSLKGFPCPGRTRVKSSFLSASSVAIHSSKNALPMYAGWLSIRSPVQTIRSFGRYTTVSPPVWPRPRKRIWISRWPFWRTIFEV